MHDYARALWDEGCAQANGSWLHDLVGSDLRNLGHDIALIDAQEPALRPLLEGGDRTKAERIRRWSWLYSEPAAASDQACILSLIDGAGLVIGFEMAPNQMRILDEAGHKVIDFAIGPIRFASDLFFALRTNDRQLAAALDLARVPDSSLVMDPRYDSVSNHPVVPRSTDNLPALFVGQTDTDAALVSQGRFVTIEPFLSQLRHRFEDGAGLLLKPHPYGREHRDIRILHAALPMAKFMSDNIYSLLASRKVREVVTISSGVATEAAFFGVPATTLICPDKDADAGAAAANEPIRILLASLTPAFWQGLIGGGAIGHPPRSRDSLRNALGCSWGYRPDAGFNARRVASGDRLGFGKGQNGGDLLTFGWSTPELHATWSDGELATLLVNPGGVALDLHLDCRVFEADRRSKLGVRLQLRGGSSPDQVLELKRGVTRRIVVPIPAIREAVEVALHIEAPKSPASCGQSSDQRALGLSLTRARVVRHQAASSRWSPSALGAAAASMIMALLGF